MPPVQIKDERTYRALRREGNSEEKSARIANAAAGNSRQSVGARGGKSRSYDDWTKDELLQRARELGPRWPPWYPATSASRAPSAGTRAGHRQRPSCSILSLNNVVAMAALCGWPLRKAWANFLAWS